MRFLADENCGTSLIAALVSAGHDVKAVGRTAPGILDEAVFALARREDRILLTHDRDFGHMAEQSTARPPAVILMRLRSVTTAMRVQIVTRAVADLGLSMRNCFVVIEPASIRKRPYKD